MTDAQHKTPRPESQQRKASEILRENVTKSGIRLSVLAERAGIQYDRFVRIVKGHQDASVDEAVAIQSAIHQSMPDPLPLSQAT